MKIALVSNFQTAVCGVASFGRDWLAALERAGHQVTPVWWNEPIPDCDLVCVNWHPGTQGPRSVRIEQPYVVYLHDLPPYSYCDLQDAVCYFTSEPYTGGEYSRTVEVPYPVWDGFVPQIFGGPVSLGWTGIRGDGREQLQKLCAKRGWAFNGSDGWLDTPEEVARLASSTLIVLWYHASDRGQSLSLATACATRRPVLVNGSKMFKLAAAYPDEIYRAGWDPAVPLLEPAIDAVLDERVKGRLKYPSRIREEHSWAAAIARMEAAWTPS